MRKWVLFFIFSFVSFARASVESDPEISDVGEMPLLIGGTYVVRGKTRLYPRYFVDATGAVENAEGLSLEFAEGDPLTVLLDGQGWARVFFYGHSFARTGRPEEILMDPRDISTDTLEFVSSEGTVFMLKEFSEFREELEAGKKKGRAAKHRRPRLRIGGNKGCVAYVKHATRTMNVIYNDGKGATAALRRLGWKTVKDCGKAPIGAVASWTGGKHGAGHTAIKRAHRWCYDLGCTELKMAGFRLKDCVVH